MSRHVLVRKMIRVPKDALDPCVRVQQWKWHWVVVDLPGRGLGELPVDDRLEVEPVVDEDVLCAEVHVVQREPPFSAATIVLE